MWSAFESVRQKLNPGDELRTPDKSTGKPFLVDVIDDEGMTVRTARGGRVRISMFTFDSVAKRSKGRPPESWADGCQSRPSSLRQSE